MPNEPPQSAPVAQALRGTTCPILIVKYGGIVEFGSLVVRGQCLGGGLFINSAQTFSGVVRRLVEIFSELGKTFAQSPCEFRKTLGSEEDQDHSKNQNHFPSSEDVGEDRKICHKRLIEFYFTLSRLSIWSFSVFPT